MARPTGDDVIAAEGRRGRLVYARRLDGTMLAKEFLDSDANVKASFGQLFERLVTNGPLFPNKDQFKKMKGVTGGSVWEFKRGGEAGHRLYCVEPTSGDRWLLTHHYQKGKSKGDQTRSAKLALTISAEHIEREQKLETEGTAGMTLKSEITSTPEGLRLWHQERSIFETTNMICELMEQLGVSRAELAKRLHCTKGYVTQLLDGSANMTLRTVSDAFTALGYEFRPDCARLAEKDAGRAAEQRPQRRNGIAKIPRRRRTASGSPRAKSRSRVA